MTSRIVENPFEPRLGTQSRLVNSPNITYIVVLPSTFLRILHSSQWISQWYNFVMQVYPAMQAPTCPWTQFHTLRHLSVFGSSVVLPSMIARRAYVPEVPEDTY